MSKARVNASSLQHKEDFYVLPEDLVIDEGLNGRLAPHSQAAVEERAWNMIKHGQLAPVLIRKLHNDKGRPTVVAGFLRSKAAIYINTVLLPAGKVQKPFRLWVSMRDSNELDAFKANILENLERKSTTVMDMVTNQAALRRLGCPDSEIAELYHMPVGQINHNSKLLSLPRELQLMIHEGIISAEAGHHLLTVSEAEQKQIVESAKEEAIKSGKYVEASEQSFIQHHPAETSQHEDYVKGSGENSPTEGSTPVENVSTADGGKKGKGTKSKTKRPAISTKVIKNKVRNAKSAKGEKGPNHSLSELKKFWNTQIGKNASKMMNEDDKDFLTKWMAFSDGEITEAQMLQAIVKHRKSGNTAVLADNTVDEVDVVAFQEDEARSFEDSESISLHGI